MDYIDIVFDGPPSPEGARFVEVEDSRGRSINFGEWCSGRMDIGRFAFLRTHGSRGSKVMLEDELQRIYDSEINVRIS